MDTNIPAAIFIFLVHVEVVNMKIMVNGLTTLEIPYSVLNDETTDYEVW